MAYDDETVLEAKRLIVQKGKTAKQAARALGGSPAASTIRTWIKGGRLADKPWDELRTEYAQSLMTDTSPAAMAREMHRDLMQLMEEMPAGSKKADAVAKYARSIRKLVEPKMRVSMMYETLEELMAYLQANADGALDQQLIHAIRDFKNDLRDRLLKENRTRE